MSGEPDRDRRNYWVADPTLQRVIRRAYERADAANNKNDEEPPTASTDSNREHDRFAVAEPSLRDYGRVVAETIADNADLIDDRGPTLHTYDRDGEVRNHVEYHPAQFENERLTYGPDAGVVAYAFHAPPDGEEPLGLLHTLSMGALLSYADPGLYCPVSMTAGVALVLDRFDDGRLGESFDRRSTPTEQSVMRRIDRRLTPSSRSFNTVDRNERHANQSVTKPMPTAADLRV